MKHSITTSIIILATPEQVWEQFIDFESYPKWNPFIKSIKGEVKVGNRIFIQLPSMNFKPKVTALVTDRKLSWLGHFMVKGLLDGEHRFELIENLDGSTTFQHSEIFTGILTGIFKRKLEGEITADFNKMNQALKKRVELRINI